MTNASTLIKNIVASFGIKGLALVVSFFSTPCYLAFFNDNSILGLWFAIVSVLNWVLFFDFGLGNGLRNKIVACRSRGSNEEARKYVSSAYLSLGILSAGMSIVLIAAIYIAPVSRLFGIGVHAISTSDLRAVLSIVVIGTALQLWLRLITAVLYAFEKTALPSFIALISNAAVLLALFVPLRCSAASKLFYIAWVQVLSMNLPLLIATVYYFLTKFRELIPSFRYISLEHARSVCGLGGKFFIIQVCLMVITSSNEMLIARLVGSESVVYYSTYFRLFNLAITLFGLLVQPIWSSMGLAIEEKRYRWIKNVHSKFVMAAIALTALCFIGANFIHPIFRIWLGSDTLVPSIPYAYIFAAYTGSMLLLNASSCYANASNALTAQMMGLGCGAVLKIPLSILIGHLGIGWIGVVFATILCLVPTSLIQTIVARRDINLKLLNNE